MSPRPLSLLIAAAIGVAGLALPAAASAVEDVRFYEHTDMRGDYFVPETNGDYEVREPDFRSVDCFMWWCENFNDRVSSVRLNPQIRVTLYEHIGYGGASREFYNNRSYAVYYNLPAYGWNDRASSAYSSYDTIGTIEQPVGVVSSGTTELKGTYTFDLETGVQGGTGPGVDLWWEQVDQTTRRLCTQNGALLAHLGKPDYYSVSLTTLQAAAYSAAPIDGSNTSTNQLTAGSVIAVKTGSGHFAKLKINTYGYNLGITWTTYS